MADWFRRLWCGLHDHGGITIKRIGASRWVMFGCKQCGQSWVEVRFAARPLDTEEAK